MKLNEWNSGKTKPRGGHSLGTNGPTLLSSGAGAAPPSMPSMDSAAAAPMGAGAASAGRRGVAGVEPWMVIAALLIVAGAVAGSLFALRDEVSSIPSDPAPAAAQSQATPDPAAPKAPVASAQSPAPKTISSPAPVLANPASAPSVRASAPDSAAATTVHTSTQAAGVLSIPPIPPLRPLTAPRTAKGEPTSVHNVPVHERYVALTFDDGPSPDTTRKIMEMLEQRSMRATFFFIGKQVKQNPDLVREVAERGFEIGNHSTTHANLPKLDPAKARAEIDDCQVAIEATGAPMPTLVRFPYGNSTKALRSYVDGKDLLMVHWSIDTLDWARQTTAEHVYKTVAENLEPGAIILMHERPEATWDALPRILDLIEKEGYRTVTVSELLSAAEPKVAAASGN